MLCSYTGNEMYEGAHEEEFKTADTKENFIYARCHNFARL